MLKYVNPLVWSRWISQFFYAWCMAIPWRDAPKAIPAIILMIVLVVTSVIAWSDTSNWRSELLNNQLQVALDQENYETAELVLDASTSATSGRRSGLASSGTRARCQRRHRRGQPT